MAPISPQETKPSSSRRWTVVFAIAFPALLTIIGLALMLFFREDAQLRSLRDILLILLALEFMVVGVALSLLMIQLARLSLLIEMEVRPMVRSAEETLRHLSGTVQFLDENLVDPIMKLNTSLAGVQRLLNVFHLFRRPSK
jgi:hypothetical protein